MTFGEDETGEFGEVRINRERTIETIVTNLIKAGVLLPEETSHYRETLKSYDTLTLVKVLLESHLLRDTHEEAQH